mmetsp:Transcript_32461/g.49671  ORF Transcript_32461/g.49671 Transcript_32461/m.49671 type:complete len:93 (+) Transcript_32461:749-1027(+)
MGIGPDCPVPYEEQLLNLELVRSTFQLGSEKDVKMMRFCSECDTQFTKRFRRKRNDICFRSLVWVTILLILVLAFFLLERVLDSSRFHCPEG